MFSGGAVVVLPTKETPWGLDDLVANSTSQPKNWLQLCWRSLVPSCLPPHQGLHLPRSLLLTSSLCREFGGTSISVSSCVLILLSLFFSVDFLLGLLHHPLAPFLL